MSATASPPAEHVWVWYDFFADRVVDAGGVPHRVPPGADARLGCVDGQPALRGEVLSRVGDRVLVRVAGLEIWVRETSPSQRDPRPAA